MDREHRDHHLYELDLLGRVERLTRERDEAREKLARCVEALEQIDRETRSASDVAALRYGSIARVVLAAAKGE